eukprot:361735-Chlamydomonas_euryale.AAC.8
MDRYIARWTGMEGGMLGLQTLQGPIDARWTEMGAGRLLVRRCMDRYTARWTGMGGGMLGLQTLQGPDRCEMDGNGGGMLGLQTHRPPRGETAALCRQSSTESDRPSTWVSSQDAHAHGHARGGRSSRNGAVCKRMCARALQHVLQACVARTYECVSTRSALQQSLQTHRPRPEVRPPLCVDTHQLSQTARRHVCHHKARATSSMCVLRAAHTGVSAPNGARQPGVVA